MHPANAEAFMAFDVGLKRTGVAVGSQHSGGAEPLTTLIGKSGQLDWEQVDRLLETWAPNLCIIGDPKTTNPHLNKLIRRLTHHLQVNGFRVVMVDEHLTSVAANAHLADTDYSTAQRQEKRDQVAACLILERYLESRTPN